MTNELDIRTLDEKDRAYALASWREAHHDTSAMRRMPWAAYKVLYGKLFEQLLRDGRALGAYRTTPHEDSYAEPIVELLGFLVMSPGKRVNTLHWVQTKYKDADGKLLRRRGVMTELLAAAELGTRFAYTLRARKEKNTTLDVVLAKKLLEQNIVATHVPLKEWIK